MLWWISHQRELKEVESAVHSLRRAEKSDRKQEPLLTATPVKVKTGTKLSTEGNMNKFCEMFIDLSKQDNMPWQKHFAKIFLEVTNLVIKNHESWSETHQPRGKHLANWASSSLTTAPVQMCKDGNHENSEGSGWILTRKRSSFRNAISTWCVLIPWRPPCAQRCSISLFQSW